MLEMKQQISIFFFLFLFVFIHILFSYKMDKTKETEKNRVDDKSQLNNEKYNSIH